MIRAIVPTDRKKERWQDRIQTERQYKICVGSGLAWVIHPELPLSWAGCLEELNKEGCLKAQDESN